MPLRRNPRAIASARLRSSSTTSTRTAALRLSCSACTAFLPRRKEAVSERLLPGQPPDPDRGIGTAADQHAVGGLAVAGDVAGHAEDPGGQPDRVEPGVEHGVADRLTPQPDHGAV